MTQLPHPRVRVISKNINNSNNNNNNNNIQTNSKDNIIQHTNSTSSTSTSSSKDNRVHNSSSPTLANNNSTHHNHVSSPAVAKRPIQFSSYSNLAGNCVTKHNLSASLISLPPSSRCSSLLKCNQDFFCVPSSTIGSLSLRPISSSSHTTTTTTAALDSSFNNNKWLITAHSVSLLDYEFYPFSNCLVTSGMDNCIKLWNLPPSSTTDHQHQQSSAANIENVVNSTHTIQCDSPANRIFFHPMVSNLMITSHHNKQVQLWDIEHDSSLITTQQQDSHSDIVDSVIFSHDGSLMVTACRDRIVRFFDPRTSMNELFQVNSQMRSLHATWLGNSPYILTCGSSQNAKREFAIYDTRRMTNCMIQSAFHGSKESVIPVVRHVIDAASSQLYPFFLPSNNVLFLCGKGDQHVRFYDISILKNEDPSIVYQGEHKFSASQHAMWLMPRHSLDVKHCEIARFLRLADQTVETISFTVPRKNLDLFQEDLYTGEPISHEPTSSLQDWVSGQSSIRPRVMNYQPNGMKSVYDVSVEEGGKIREVHDSDTESDYSEHDSDSDSEDIDQTPLKSEPVIVPTEDNSNEIPLRIRALGRARGKATLSPRSPPVLPTEQIVVERGDPTVQKPEQITPRKRSRAVITPIIASNFTQKSTSQDSPRKETNKLAGYLFKKTASSLTWRRRWCVFEHDKIYYFENQQSTSPAGKIALNDLTSVSRSNRKENSLKLCFSSRKKMYLAAESKILCEEWLSKIRSVSTENQQHGEKNDNTFTLSGFLNKLNNVGSWQKRYFDYSIDDHILTYRSKPGSSALGHIHLEKLLSVTRGTTSDKLSKKRQFCFQVNTVNRKYVLQAPSESDCELWVRTLEREVLFIKSLNHKNSSEMDKENLDNNIRGQMIRFSEGTLMKRWLYYSDTTSTLYIFVSHNAEQKFVEQGELIEKDLEQMITLDEIINITDMSEDQASMYHIPRKDAIFYILLKTPDHKRDVILLARDVQHKQSWKDALLILKEADSKRKENEKEIEPKPVIEQLGIADISAVIPKTVPIFDMTAFKAGKHKMLLHIKGKTEITVSEVAISAQSLRNTDCFILDDGRTLYQWNGRLADRRLRAKAYEIASTICFNERGGLAELRVINSGSKMDIEIKRYNDEFWSILSKMEKDKIDPKRKEMKSADCATIQLYRVSRSKDMHKMITCVRIQREKKPSHSLLNSKYVYVLDTGSEIFVWIGRNSTSRQKHLGLLVASKLLQDSRDKFVRITKVLENAESVLWKEKFADYACLVQSSEIRCDAAESKSQINISDLLDIRPIRPRARAYSVMPQFLLDQSRYKFKKIKIWRINQENNSKYDHPNELYGTFFAEEIYAILISWCQESESTDRHSVFYWQGRDATGKVGTSLVSTSIDDHIDGIATQLIVDQNKEPDFLMQAFNGQMIIRNGSHDTTSTNQPELFELRYLSNIHIQAIQIECNPSSLNSMHCYILCTEQKLFIWEGNLSTSIERDAAKAYAHILYKSREIVRVSEASNDADFCRKIGLTSSVNYSKFTADGFTYKSLATRPPKLFCCLKSENDSTLVVEEVTTFVQDDLDPNKCFILLGYGAQQTIFIWLGKSASDSIKKYTLDLCQSIARYLNSLDPNSGGYRIEETLVVTPGLEPIEFSCNFRAWVNRQSNFNRRRSTITRTQASVPSSSNVLATLPLESFLKQYRATGHTYPYTRLLMDPLPQDVDPLRLESYLADDEFANLFEISKSSFYKLPHIKQNELKKRWYLLPF